MNNLPSVLSLLIWDATEDASTSVGSFPPSVKAIRTIPHLRLPIKVILIYRKLALKLATITLVHFLSLSALIRLWGVHEP